MECSNLATVTFDGTPTLTSIGNHAFESCYGLTSITIPASVTSIGVYAFMECSNLATVTFDGTPTLTSIGDGAFESCYGLTSITIPASVTSIGKSVFGGCSNLATMTVETENAVYDSRDGCNAIIEKSSNTLIAGCKGTTIPAGVTTIGNYAFYYCSGLTSITIPASVTSIGNGAFESCNGLTSITIPASVTSIGDYAFMDCSNLATVTLNSYPFIGYGAFYGIADGATVTMNLTGHEGETGEYWMTFYNDSYNFQADANTQVFKAALDEKSLTLTELAEDKIVRWDNAVILKSTSSSMVMTLTTTDSSNDFSNNWLCGVDDPAGLVGDGTIYVLGKGSGGVGFYKLETGSTLGYGKAYLEYDGASPSNFFGFEDGETTRVIQIENGKLKVENLNSGWYTLGGLKLQGEPTEKGVYIYNGKKVVK